MKIDGGNLNTQTIKDLFELLNIQMDVSRVEKIGLQITLKDSE